MVRARRRWRHLAQANGKRFEAAQAEFWFCLLEHRHTFVIDETMQRVRALKETVRKERPSLDISSEELENEYAARLRRKSVDIACRDLLPLQSLVQAHLVRRMWQLTYPIVHAFDRGQPLPVLRPEQVLQEVQVWGATKWLPEQTKKWDSLLPRVLARVDTRGWRAAVKRFEDRWNARLVSIDLDRRALTAQSDAYERKLHPILAKYRPTLQQQEKARQLYFSSGPSLDRDRRLVWSTTRDT